MNSREVLEYLRTCKFCKIVMGTDYENDDRYPTIYDIFYEEIEIIEKDLNRLEELEKETAKLKKVIDILKEVLKRVFIFKFGENIDNGGHISITKIDCNNTTIVNIRKEEYELLKEVFRND